MAALKWYSRGSLNSCRADGRYPGWSYELRRDRPSLGAGYVWSAWFDDGNGDPQKLGQGNFIQARKAAITHHSRDEAWI